MERNKSQKYFSAQTQTLWQNANMRSTPTTTTSTSTSTTAADPHLSASPLWRKLNICLFSPSLLQNLASLSNFSFFFFSLFFFFLVRSGIPLPQPNSIYCTFFFFFSFFCGSPSPSRTGDFWDWALGLRARSKPPQDEPQSSLDPRKMRLRPWPMCRAAGSLDWSAPHLRTSAPCIHWNNKLTQRAARLWAVAKPSESTLPKWGLIFQSVSLMCASRPCTRVLVCAICVRASEQEGGGGRIGKAADHVCG